MVSQRLLGYKANKNPWILGASRKEMYWNQATGDRAQFYPIILIQHQLITKFMIEAGILNVYKRLLLCFKKKNRNLVPRALFPSNLSSSYLHKIFLWLRNMFFKRRISRVMELAATSCLGIFRRWNSRWQTRRGRARSRKRDPLGSRRILFAPVSRDSRACYQFARDCQEPGTPVNAPPIRPILY